MILLASIVDGPSLTRPAAARSGLAPLCDELSVNETARRYAEAMSLDPGILASLAAGVVAGGGVVVFGARRRAIRARQELAASRNLLRQAMGSLQSGAVLASRDGAIALANPVATALGLVATDGSLSADVVGLLERACATGTPAEAEVAVRRGVLGEAATLLARATPLDGGLALVEASARSELRDAEQFRREFAVNVSHELKTPIGALVLLAETLEEVADEPAAVREFASKIGREATRLARLTQEIIEISRLQGADSVVEPQRVAIGAVIAEAVDAARTGAEARRITLAVSTEPDSVVMGDHAMLVNALRNLVDNAVSYSSVGGRVAVTTAVDGDVTEISVVDHGIGIALQDQERIFERFYRADPARARATGGTGLGLSIVKHIAAQHGGEVTVWSRRRVGSTFTLRLPRAQEDIA
jgi:two-component system sensor histidine kinase SenX3